MFSKIWCKQITKNWLIFLMHWEFNNWQLMLTYEKVEKRMQAFFYEYDEPSVLIQRVKESKRVNTLNKVDETFGKQKLISLSFTQYFPRFWMLIDRGIAQTFCVYSVRTVCIYISIKNDAMSRVFNIRLYICVRTNIVLE